MEYQKDGLADSQAVTAGTTWAPLAPVLLAAALGIAFDRFVSPWGTATWAALALGAGAAALLAPSREVTADLAVLVAFLGVGGGWHHAWWSDRTSDDLSLSTSDTPRPAWLRGVVREVLGMQHVQTDRNGSSSHPENRRNSRDSWRTRFVLDITATNDGQGWRPASGRAMASVNGGIEDLLGGVPIEVVGQMSTVAGPLNPGEFDYRAFLRGQGIDLRLTIASADGIRPDPEGRSSPLARLLGKLRAWSRASLVGGTAPEVEPLAAALLLGRREGVDPEVNDAFARTGTTHLLAISGLHMQVLAGALLLAARALGVPRRPAFLGVALATIGYAALVGPAPSVVRSTIMTVTFCLAEMAGRMTRPANILALAALGTLAVNPTYLFDVGCQLSFLAIAALGWLVAPAEQGLGAVGQTVRGRLLGPPSPLDELERRLETGWKKGIRSVIRNGGRTILASTVVWLAALPLVAMRFHVVSPIGILLNVPLIPLTSTALLLGGSGMALSAVWGPAGAWATRAAGWLLEWTQTIVLWGVARPWGYWFSPGPGWAWTLLFYTVLGLAAAASVGPAIRPGNWRSGRVWAWCGLAVWSLMGLALAWFPGAPRTSEADVLAVGHGLAVVVQGPGGGVVLYDGGRMGDPSVGRRIIAPALWSRGVSRIDEVILSHADQDHYNGLPDLLDRFAIELVRVPEGFGGPANPEAERLLAQIQSRGVPIVSAVAGETWNVGGARLAVQHPPAGWYPEAPDNARSLVIDVSRTGRHLLLTGDIEGIGLTALIKQPSPNPPPDILLSPHHGGRAANPAALYHWASPRAVVVSQRPPREGVADALAPLEQQGIPLWRTGSAGAIRLRWADDRIVAKGFLSTDESEKPVKGSTTMHRPGAGSFPLAFVEFASLSIGIRALIVLSGFALGVALWAVLTIVEFGAWILVVPPRASRRGRQESDVGAGEQPGHEVLSEAIESTAVDGVRLAGRWYPASGHDAHARTILLLHGFAEDPSVWEKARAAILNAHGWNVAAVDSRGYGQSGGLHASFGGHEAMDVSAWLDAISARVGVPGRADPFQAALWGRSMGAAIAMRAAERDDRIAVLVLESPMVDLDRSVARLLRKRKLRATGLLARLITARAGRIAGVSLRRPRPLDVAPRLKAPALILHGTDDWLVPADEVRRLAGSFPQPPERIEIPGAGHSNVIATGGDELIARVAGFLDAAVSKLP